jgi:hypothetical protein
MPKHSASANVPRLPALSRRSFLAGSAAATLAAPQSLTATHVDAELTALGAAFEQALAAYESAQRRFNASEGRYFDLKPPRPAVLTSDGPLGHLLDRNWDSWTAKELRALLADPDARDDWDVARAMLPVARAYETRLRRLSRVIGLDDAEAAYHAAGDILCELCARVADQPARSLTGLAVKARVVKAYAAPDWWCENGTPERIAAQLLDAVLDMAEPRRGASAQSEACAAT